jgi:hypothetical protein
MNSYKIKWNMGQFNFKFYIDFLSDVLQLIDKYKYNFNTIPSSALSSLSSFLLLRFLFLHHCLFLMLQLLEKM